MTDNNYEREQLHMVAIVESSDDAIIGKTLNGVIQSWNTSAQRIFGYTAEEAIGQHINLIIPIDRRDEEFVILGKVKAGERVEHFETIRRRKNGELFDISLTVSPIKNAEGVVIGASKIARDMSAIKEAERASAYLAAIIASSDDAIISKDLNGIITSWNPAAERIFGYTQEEAVGQHITLLIPNDKLDEEYAILGKVKSGQRVEHFETLRQRKDGSLLNISLTVSPILDSKGNMMGASKIARDISERKMTETILLETNRRKDEFLANMSHELRTPMNAVLGLTNILGMSASLSSKEKQYVTTLKHSAESLMGLINNLLDYSKLETGLIEFEEIEFNLPELIEKTVNLMAVKAQEKNLGLQAHYRSDVNHYYFGDPTRLQQILLNLIGNAVKFTEAGTIDINISAETKSDEDTVLVIDVIDTGVGIASEKLDVIFERFSQADASITRKFGGSGLGLSICRALLDQMGGDLSVQSREGLGSTFTVRLPVRNSEQQSILAAENSEDSQNKKNVLVVEDYEPNVMVVTAMLEQMGYDYDVAGNGSEAVRKFQTNLYDVILMDVQMPVMDGFESTRRIRKLEGENKREQTPIIAMTAHVMEKDRHKCFEAGMTDFIPKPFDPSILQAKLGEFTHPQA